MSSSLSSSSSSSLPFSLLVLVMVTVVVAEWGVSVAAMPVPVVPVPVSVSPSVRIVVHSRRRRASHWDPWQINSNICPPSLCRAASENSPVPAPRPRGTGGSVFYQGDIVLDEAIDRYIFPEVNHMRFRRATVRLRNRTWPDGVVPYVMGDSVKAQAKRVILRAFKHISKKTCITFRQRKGDQDKDFITFNGEPGCWSYIGRTGGEQSLSLGRGCENVGPAVHEITHALGVWHEQARQDRDSYVRILEDNVSERFLKDFEKLDHDVSSSRGFPYDYTSIMHYSRHAFSRNGKPTIEVIGVGRKLGLTIKQRSELSTIDTAQLRDMYRCNLKTDNTQTRCPKGWHHQHDTSCYKFFPHPKLQFAAAAKRCQEEGSHLLWVERQREQRHLARHLHTHFPFVYTWRMGARQVNGSMTWYRGKDLNPIKMDYSHWAPGQPASFSTGVLQRDRSTNETRWDGVWAGSRSQLPYFIYPFICERRAKRPCLQKLKHRDGREYRGKLDHTVDGITCQKWSEQYPHQHNLTTQSSSSPSSSSSDDDDKDEGSREGPGGLGDHNYCRNPKAQRRSRPWCFTTKSHREWQLCDVTACPSSSSSGGSNRKPSSDSNPEQTRQTSQRGRRSQSNRGSSSSQSGVDRRCITENKLL